MAMNHRERDEFVPPNCAECGRPLEVNWVQVATLGDDTSDPDLRQWVPGSMVCTFHEEGA